MNARINEDEHPNRRTHIPNSSPHTQHRPSVMIRLQCRTPLSLGENNARVEDFVEFADIKHPAPESQSFIPQPSNIRRVRVAVGAEMDERILHLPDIQRSIIRSSIPKPSRSMHLTQAIRRLRRPILTIPARQGLLDSPEHRHERREAVKREHDIVHHDEVPEPFLATYAPCLVVSVAVVAVECEDCEDICCGEEDGDFGPESEVVEVLVDAERCAQRAFC